MVNLFSEFCYSANFGISPAIHSSGVSERRIHTICFSVDELSSNEGDYCSKHDPDVGHIPCEFHRIFWSLGSSNIVCFRQRVQTLSPSFICMFVLLFLYGGVNSFARWISRLVVRCNLGRLDLIPIIGNHHVSPIVTNAGMGRP